MMKGKCQNFFWKPPFFFLRGIIFLRKIQIKRKGEEENVEKIKVYETDGKTRDERESCFPNSIKIEKRRGYVLDDGEK